MQERLPILAKAISEMVPLAVLGFVGVGLTFFIRVAGEAIEGETSAFDEALISMLRTRGDPSDPVGPPWFETAFADITALGGYSLLTLIVFMASIYLLLAGKRSAALITIGAVGSGAILSELLKLGYARPRPDLVSHLVQTGSNSLPSGHAMLSAVTYLTLGGLLARVHSRRQLKGLLIGYALLITILVGASRVYLGVHWPTDVLAGWGLGAAWAAAWWLVAWWLQVRGGNDISG